MDASTLNLEPTLAEVCDRLYSDPKPRHLSTKRQGGSTITYVAWPVLCDYLDHLAPGWEWKVSVEVGHERLFLLGSLTVHGCDGSRTMMATGTEKLDKDSFGDPSSNAEAMALRRCLAKFGFARSLWRK